MKKLALVMLMLCLVIPAVALAGVIAFNAQVDQDTKVYYGNDTTNYMLIPAGTNYGDVTEASQVKFTCVSTARTTAPNLRVSFMQAATGHRPELSKDGGAQKMQSFRTDAVGNYYLTKALTIPLNP